MPIIIRELTIKATVDNQSQSADSPRQTQSGKIKTDKIVEQCVEQVMEILNQQKER